MDEKEKDYIFSKLGSVLGTMRLVQRYVMDCHLAQDLEIRMNELTMESDAICSAKQDIDFSELREKMEHIRNLFGTLDWEMRFLEDELNKVKINNAEGAIN